MSRSLERWAIRAGSLGMAFAVVTVMALLGWMYCKCYGLTWLLLPAIPSGLCLVGMVVLFLIAESTGR